MALILDRGWATLQSVSLPSAGGKGAVDFNVPNSREAHPSKKRPRSELSTIPSAAFQEVYRQLNLEGGSKKKEEAQGAKRERHQKDKNRPQASTTMNIDVNTNIKMDTICLLPSGSSALCTGGAFFHFPSTSAEHARYRVFVDLWERGSKHFPTCW